MSYEIERKFLLSGLPEDLAAYPVQRIEQGRFEALWPLTEGRRVVKTRHLVPLGAFTAEVDVYAEALDGLLTAEVEFASVEQSQAFRPPGWMGDEVTGDDRYANRNLAI